MKRDELRQSIIRRVIELEKHNIFSGYPRSKDEMVREVEKILAEELAVYEASQTKA